MSRIQEILAKAERDGTARRTQSSGSFAPAPAPAQFPPQPAQRPSTGSGRAEHSEGRVDGTSALDAAPIAPPLLATIAAAPAAAEGRTVVATLHPLLVAAIDPHSEIAERYRSLRASISHREETMPIRTLMVTSPGDGDGKSITAANLALTMAQELQRRVVLADADFRDPSVHSLFGLDDAPGLAEVLAGEATLDEVMVSLPDYRLTVIPAGRTPQFPTELLGSTAMRRVVDTLRGRFDRVLFDTPAVMPLADAATVGAMADGVLMVVRAGHTLRPALNRALAAFDEQKLLGVVLNDTL